MWFSHFSIVITICHGESLGCNKSKWLWHSFVYLVAPYDDQLPLMLSYWCSIYFLFHHYILTRMNILIGTFQGRYLLLTYLCFCIKYSLSWGPFESKLLSFFFDISSDFWYPGKGKCLLFVSVVIIIVAGATCFLFKIINYLL